MNITIGVPLHNCVNFTKLTFQSLIDFTAFSKHKITLVIIDNASTDETPKYLEEFKETIANLSDEDNYPTFDKIVYVRFEDNPGCSKSFNEIYKTFDANNDDLCILINNDIVFSKDWLEQLLEFYHDFGEAGLFSPHVIDNHEPESTRSKWFGDVRNGNYFISPEWQEYVNAVREKEKHTFDEGIQGPVLCVTKECRNAVGDWDENFIKGCYDDCDYVYRAQAKGFATYITHNSVIFHWGGSTQNYINTHGDTSNYLYKNKMYFQKKWNVNLDAIGAICNRSIFWTHPREGVNEKVYL